MAQEKEKPGLVAELETEHEGSVNPEAVGYSIIAIEAMISDLQNAYAHDQQLVIALRAFSKGCFEIVIELAAATAPLIAYCPLPKGIFKVINDYHSAKLKLARRHYHCV